MIWPPLISSELMLTTGLRIISRDLLRVQDLDGGLTDDGLYVTRPACCRWANSGVVVLGLFGLKHKN